jgi:hypothetical protein
LFFETGDPLVPGGGQVKPRRFAKVLFGQRGRSNLVDAIDADAIALPAQHVPLAGFHHQPERVQYVSCQARPTLILDIEDAALEHRPRDVNSLP